MHTHAAVGPCPSTRAFDHELSGASAAVVGAALLGGAAWVNVSLTGRLGWFFGLCFVLAALSVALVVNTEGLFAAGVLPPLLMVALLTVTVLVAPEAIDAAHLANSAGGLQRVIAGVVDHATALVVGHVLALTIIALRIRAAAAPS